MVIICYILSFRLRHWLLYDQYEYMGFANGIPTPDPLMNGLDIRYFCDEFQLNLFGDERLPCIQYRSRRIGFVIVQYPQRRA